MTAQNLNCDKTKKLKIWHLTNKNVIEPKGWENWKTQVVKNSKTQIVTKLKLWQNSNCEKAQKLNMGQNYRT